ncbi:MAG: M13 family metallopeptidase, partial [Cyclobacteriaceae bacterium]|nr:M13 family metallopeptidase [Cyclobacteriaceae bacterium]
LGSTNRVMGEAIGKVYVAETFPPEAKANAEEMVANLIRAFESRIQKLEWMSAETKEQALKKLSKLTVKIGYPDEWKDYSGLKVENAGESYSYLGNMENAWKFEFGESLKDLGQPVDKKEWGMSPQTVNAYFNPLNNEIVFPAAILQPPFYNYKADAAMNYGGMGAVIGHEISHGFDDQGSRFDPEGNMVNWWTEEDQQQFESRTSQLVAQFDSYQPLDSVFVQGRLTLGENIGDLGGLNAAYDALQLYYQNHDRPDLIDGFTQEQRFFISWATIWRTKYRDETLRTQILTDPHSPGMYRAIGPLVNMELFFNAFDIKEGDKLWKPEAERVIIW